MPTEVNLKNDVISRRVRTNGEQLGKCTCRETSVVDYFITASSLFRYVNSLNIQDYCPLLSDINNAVSVEFSFNTTLVLEII